MRRDRARVRLMLDKRRKEQAMRSPHAERLPAHPPLTMDLTRLLLGLVVLALGIVFLLDAAGALDGDRVVDRWWPVLLVAVGVFQLLERPRSRVVPLILVGAGATLLLFTTDVANGDPGPYVGPVILIAIGVAILGRWTSRALPASGDDVVRGAGIFGGPRLASTSQQFRGAALTALFGGVTLDLRQARPVAGGASVTATAAFGGIDILVPRGWKVAISGTPVFGGVEDKTDRSVPPEPDAPILNVDAMAVFGGVEVKHGKDQP
jgi:hypothetical protein